MESITQEEFNIEVQDLAENVLNDYNLTEVDYFDAVHEVVDGHQWIIYTYQAQMLCCGVDTTAGVDWLCELNSEPFAGCDTLGQVHTKVAYAALYEAVLTATETLLDTIGTVLTALGDDFTEDEILSALCDGEAMAKLGLTDETAVTDTHNYIKDSRA